MSRIPLTNEVAQPDAQPVSEVKQTDSTPISDSVEVPYSYYKEVKGKPFLVDHFQLGDTWDDPVGGFPKEIALMEDYFKGRVEYGEIANTIEAVKDELKKMEKFTNVKEDSRPLVKIETLAAYIEFLKKTANIKVNLRRYGTR